MDERLTLEKRIQAETASYDGKMAVYADDLRGNVIAIYPDEKFETASTVKTYILACLFDQAEKGNACLEDMIVFKPEHMVEGSGVLCSLEPGLKLRVKDAATLMIIVSDNVATNMVIEYLGRDRINQCIRELGCKDTVLHNDIHFDRYRQLGTTTPRDYGGMFIRLAKRELISKKADEEMLSIFGKQHYNSMLTGAFPPYFLDSEDTGEEELISVASKSGSMNACRNDGGIITTPYGSYVLVMMHKEFSDAIYYPGHPATVFGAKVSRMILDQYLALEGRFYL